MVPRERLELSTSALPRMRSTTELTRRAGMYKSPEGGAIAKVRAKTKQKITSLAIIPRFSYGKRVTDVFERLVL